MKLVRLVLKKVYNFNRRKKSGFLIFIDALIVFLTFFAMFHLDLGADQLTSSNMLMIWLSPIVAISLLVYFNFYKIVVRRFSLNGLWIITLLKASVIFVVIITLITFLLTGLVEDFQSRGIGPTVLSMLFIVILRILIKYLFVSLAGKKRHLEIKRILIYGAGEAGSQLKSIVDTVADMEVVAFIDDDEDLDNRIIDGLNVYNLKHLSSLRDSLRINEVLVAIPSLGKERHVEIISKLSKHKVSIRTLPNVSEIAHGRVQIHDLHTVDIKKLLERNPISPNESLLDISAKGKVIMITGAGGSIGSELCRQVVNLNPKKIILLDQSEFALYSINEELIERAFEVGNKLKIYPVLGSVLDQNHIERVVEYFSVDTIYHAAAYKHVPMVELNTIEGLKNNVFGTLSCVQAAINKGVTSFVLISTDKAVRPTNVMGASKRVAEMILQAFSSEESNTKFSAVRFGNVLGSSGSVIPLFEKQIRERKPVTVTHPDVKRYFMTIPEASQLVIQAGAMSNGSGSIFILDMGPLVNIYDLAEKMIYLSGLEVKNVDNPNGDIEIKITGLRKGEKLYEELVIGGEVSKTSHKMIMKVNEEFLSKVELMEFLKDLNSFIQVSDFKEIRRILINNISGYHPQHDIEDLFYKK